MRGIDLAERGMLPDPILRAGIRRLLRQRLRELDPRDGEAVEQRRRRFERECRRGPVALVPARANQQHYEVSAGFFQHVLGPRLKYSCAWWPPGVADLAAAEEAMLTLCAERAQLEDGMHILDLGCGWGSLSLWVAERLPNARVLAVSNSKTQREYILNRAARSGLTNVEVTTADVNEFDPERRFDRVLSIEMFEHVRNHSLLLSRIAGWLAPMGKLFVHHFAHRSCAYPYETSGEDDWMGRTFFSGGMMPAHDLLLRNQRDLRVDEIWCVNGRHYQRTCEAWLARQDARREALRPVLAQTYGSAQAALWHRRWRLFFLACAELFGYHNGNEWWVTHALMSPGRSGGSSPTGSSA